MRRNERALSNRLTRVISRHQRAKLTYDELDRKSDNLARGLLQRGVEKGYRVAVSLGNNVEHAVVSEWNGKATTFG